MVNMQQKEKINLSKLLLNNQHVNNYTKLLINLSRLNYYEDYYIPNKKLMNMLGIKKNRVIELLKKLEEDRIIAIFYKKRKRYFTLLNFSEKETQEYEDMKEEKQKNTEIFDYNWLEDSEYERNDKNEYRK